MIKIENFTIFQIFDIRNIILSLKNTTIFYILKNLNLSAYVENHLAQTF